jgi:SAM-dependent methyltransferase
VAAVALPPMFAAVVFLLYLDFDHLLKSSAPVPAPAQISAPTTVTPASVATAQPSPSSAASSAAEVFGTIYRDQVWGKNAEGQGTSGSGSTLRSTALYRTYLQTFLKEHNIRSVVDAGCGDWEFSKAIDWTGIDYKGFDVVGSVIATNTKKYSAKNVQFAVANIVTDDLPAADLLISKHVLQHLPNADVTTFLAQLPKYRHVLLTNGVSARSLSGDNRDIAIGAFRYLDPTQPPFNLPGGKPLSWWDGLHMHQVVHLQRRDAEAAR